MTLSFYQNGIMRCLIEQPSNTRFRISDYDLPVVEDQLNSVTDFTDKVTNSTNWVAVSNLTNESDGETYSYNISYDPFMITQYADGVETMVINKNKSLAYEIGAPPSMTETSSSWPTQSWYNASTIDFWQPASRLFGLPEREDTLMLKMTQPNGQPYQLFATDQPQHMPNNQQPLYGSVPYLTAIDKAFSSSIAMINSAHTWVDLTSTSNDTVNSTSS